MADVLADICIESRPRRSARDRLAERSLSLGRRRRSRRLFQRLAPVLKFWTCKRATPVAAEAARGAWRERLRRGLADAAPAQGFAAELDLGGQRERDRAGRAPGDGEGTGGRRRGVRGDLARARGLDERFRRSCGRCALGRRAALTRARAGRARRRSGPPCRRTASPSPSGINWCFGTPPPRSPRPSSPHDSNRRRRPLVRTLPPGPGTWTRSSNGAAPGSVCDPAFAQTRGISRLSDQVALVLGDERHAVGQRRRGDPGIVQAHPPVRVSKGEPQLGPCHRDDAVAISQRFEGLRPRRVRGRRARLSSDLTPPARHYSSPSVTAETPAQRRSRTVRSCSRA